jgi:hypothetical protein
MDCFKCSKVRLSSRIVSRSVDWTRTDPEPSTSQCQERVVADTNLLLLSDGNPVCSNCSYQVRTASGGSDNVRVRDMLTA